MRELKFEPTEQTILQAWRQVKHDFFDHLQDNMIFILKRLFEARSTLNSKVEVTGMEINWSNLPRLSIRKLAEETCCNGTTP